MPFPTVILPGVFSCSLGLTDFQIKRLSGLVRPNGRPRLLTPEVQMISQLGSSAFKRHERFSMLYIIEQVQLFFKIAVSLNTMLSTFRRTRHKNEITGESCRPLGKGPHARY
jgi:hypothetical protein